ncbi:MAG: formyltransferase family protein, partial [Candidatus Bipolaricaulota bacterium]
EVVARADFYPEGKITPDAREHYFEALYEKLKAYNPDLIVLSGFMQIVTDPLLSGFRNRILNVHPADLRIEEGGKRKFVGDDTVYDAVQAGEEHLRSSVHIVSEQVDQGALMAVSRPLPVETELVEVLKEKAPEKIRGYADALQEWLKWEGDGPCLDQALQLIARGVVGTKAKSGIVFDMGGQIVQGYYDLKGEKIRTAR